MYKKALKKTVLVQALSAALWATALTVAVGPVAFAQQPTPQPPPQQPQTVDRIEVTGSQIRRIDAETPSPVQVITSADLVNSGFTSVSEVLRNITANGNGTLDTGFNRAFAGGASGVSLRGLSLGATLVLIDGHRMAPYPLSDDGQRAFVDISSIPFDAVERIEILKDGASAVYGSDAIAGVVNVILKKSHQGTLLNAEIGTSQHGGGTTSKFSIMHGFGEAGDKQSGFVALEYRQQDQIKLNQRAGFDWTNFDWRPFGGSDMRPGAINGLAVNPRLLTPILTRPGASTNNAANVIFLGNPNCNFTSYKASQCIYTDIVSQLQPKSKNINLIGSHTLRLSDGWELNTKASVFDSQQQQTRTMTGIPNGSFAGITITGAGIVPKVVNPIPVFTVPANYPGNTFGVPANVRAFLTPGVGRLTEFDTKAYRLVSDLTGNIGAWEIKGSAGYTRVETLQAVTGSINFANLLTALNSTDPATRFNLVGGNSDAVMAFVAPRGRNKSTDELNFVEARGTRELFQMPGGPLSLGIGTSYVDKSLYNPSAKENQIGTQGIQAFFAIGKEKNTSVYAEAVAPVTKSLEIDAAVRYDYFDTYGSSTTPKAGFKFSPVDQVSFRGTVAKGFRAPNPAENGTAGSVFGFNNIRDPLLCPTSNANGTPNLTAPTNVQGACNLAAIYLQSTTKSLQPEKSTSFTLGMILEPIKRWSTTVDYYSIELKNQITSTVNSPTFAPLDHIVRATPQQVVFGDGSTGLSSVGPIAFVNVDYFNASSTKTTGIDIETHYSFKFGGGGQLTTGLAFARMLSYDVTLPDGKTYKLAGTHGPVVVGGDTGSPKDRAQFSLSYENGPLTIASTTNYISGYDVTDPSVGTTTCALALGDNANSPRFNEGTDAPSQFCKVKSFTYTNLAFQYRTTKNLTWKLSITNLFDKQPPVDMDTYGATGANASSGPGAAYNPSLHQVGAVGRFASVGMSYRF
jgi:iron complex outermembrane recepter protein